MVVNETEPVIYFVTLCQVFLCWSAWYYCWRCVQYSHSMLHNVIFAKPFPWKWFVALSVTAVSLWFTLHAKWNCSFLFLNNASIESGLGFDFQYWLAEWNLGQSRQAQFRLICAFKSIFDYIYIVLKFGLRFFCVPCFWRKFLVLIKAK